MGKREFVAIVCCTAAILVTGKFLFLQDDRWPRLHRGPLAESSIEALADPQWREANEAVREEGGENRFSRKNLPARLREVIREDETPEAQREIARLLKGLSLENLAEVIEMFNELPRDGRQYEYAFTRFMEVWAALDGAGAFGFGLAAENDPELREEFYFAAGPVLAVWAANDLAAASQAVAAGAADFGEMDRRRFAIYLMEAFVSQNPEGAVDWIEFVDARENTDAFTAECMLALSRTLAANGDAEGARALLRSQATQAFSSDAIGWMAVHTALEDPGAAWNWLAQLPGDAMGQHGLQAMMIEWGGMDEGTTRFWMDGFTKRRSFDNIVEEYVGIIRKASPPAALHWSALLEDDARRHSLFREIMASWEGSDPEAARRWAEAYSN